MPPPARISVPVKQSTQVNNDIESSSSPSSSMARAKKSRVVARRRARGRLHETDSDEEVVREPRSDSDTDTVATSLESESLSDSDSETEDEPKSRSRAPSPKDPLLITEASSPPMALPDVAESFFPKPQDWSDMVTDEKENGQAELPVIDFADFSAPEGSTPQPEDEPEPYPAPPLSPQPQPTRSHSRDKAPEDASSSKRITGFARQAYLHKLNNDPAYVPTVGQFWSHDDRLLDKNLRSLSGWWRGKWHGGGGSRGRGRGGSFGSGRGRGRGGFNNINSHVDNTDDGPWKHDRFGAEQDEKRASTSRSRGGGQGGDVWKHDLFDANEADLPRKNRAPKFEWKHDSVKAAENGSPTSAAIKPASPEPDLNWGAPAEDDWGATAEDNWAAPISSGEPFDAAVSPKDEPSELLGNKDTSDIQAAETMETNDEQDAIDNDVGAPLDNVGAAMSNHNDTFLTNDDGLASTYDGAFTSINDNEAPSNDTQTAATNDDWGASSGGGWGALENDSQRQNTSEPRRGKGKNKNKPRSTNAQAPPPPDTDINGWAAPSDDAGGWGASNDDANAWAKPSAEPLDWAVPTEETGDGGCDGGGGDGGGDDGGGGDGIGDGVNAEPNDDTGGWSAPVQDYGWAAPSNETDGGNGWGATQSGDMNSFGYNQGKSRRKAPRGGKSGNTRGGGRSKGQFNTGDGFGSPKRPASPRPPRVQQPKVRPARMRAIVQPAEPDILAFGNNVRPWFTMKPERVWTKQFDGYLYAEADLKPVPAEGLGQGVRVKLPGGYSSFNDEDVIIRLPLEVTALPSNEPVSTEPLPEGSIVIKLPSGKSLGKRREVPPATDEVTTLNLAPLNAPQPKHSAVLPKSQEYSGWEESTSTSFEIPPVSQPSENWALPAENVGEFYPPGEQVAEQTEQLDLTHSELSQPSFQTFPPPFQPSASYGSPYAYPAQGLPLPPGIAYAENGITYEIATGRAVYLQTPPPPPPPQPMPITIYNPQTMPMHGHHGSVHFVPHTSPMSMSMPPPGFPPLFSLPRQSTRVEIRRPNGGEDKDNEKEDKPAAQISQERVSGSRLAPDAQPFTPAAHMQAHTQVPEYYAAEGQQSYDDVQQPQQMMYQQPVYYYPMAADGNNPYGYAQHYPGVDIGQPQQYSSYGQEPYTGGYY